MIEGKIKDYTTNSKSWIVGDFFPAFFKTKNFEMGIHNHKANEIGQTHYHRFSREINIVQSGYVVINNRHFKTGDMFIIEPFEVSESFFMEDTSLIVLRDKSLPGDKVICE